MTSPSRVGSHSPASPRLPSPPPFPEVQIGHRSPSPSSARSSLVPTPEEHLGEDYGAARRIRPGTKAADMASGPPLVPLAELDSAFQLQEHLKSLYLAATTSPTSTDLRQPITRASATTLATPPPGVDRSLWLYELCRFLVQRANTLIVGFFSDTPPCSAANCPEMRASEWQYLCAVHDPPKSCCAIDYCCHTLDWAAGILTSQRHFPSRLTLGSASISKDGAAGFQSGAGGDAASVRQLTNIFRRVYRMFAHAWFQHRDVFWTIENQEGLYIFYKTVCDLYNLIPEDNYTVPTEAEGLGGDEKQTDDGGWTREHLHGSSNASTPNSETSRSTRPSSLDFGRGNNASFQDEHSSQLGEAGDAPTIVGIGATQRRHKHTPSTGSFVTTIHEGDEDLTSPPPESSGEPFFNTSTQTASADARDINDSKGPKTARRIETEKEEIDQASHGAETSQEIPTIIAPSETDGDAASTLTTDKDSDANAKDSSSSHGPMTSSTTEESNTTSNSSGTIITTEEIPSPSLEEKNTPEHAELATLAIPTKSSNDQQSPTTETET